jgi:hypothetical protein
MTPFIKVEIMPKILLLIGTVYWGRVRMTDPVSGPNKKIFLFRPKVSPSAVVD